MISTVQQVKQLHEPFFNPSYTQKKLWDETAKKCPNKPHKLPRTDFEARFKRLVLEYRNNASRNKTYTNQCELSFMNAHIFKNQLVFFDANQNKRNYVCNESGTISRGIYFALIHNKLSCKILLDVLKESPYEIITQANFKDVDFGSDHDDDDYENENDIDAVIESHNDTNDNVREDNTEAEPNEDHFESICHVQKVETEFSNKLDELEIAHASYQSPPRKKTKSEPSDLSNNPHDETVEEFMKNMETHIPDLIPVNKKSYVLIEESLYNPKINDTFNSIEVT